MFICNYFKNIKKETTKNTKYTKYKLHTDFYDNECIICLENMTAGEDIILIDCGHLYHANCLVEWFKKKTVCPICDFVI